MRINGLDGSIVSRCQFITQISLQLQHHLNQNLSKYFFIEIDKFVLKHKKGSEAKINWKVQYLNYYKDTVIKTVVLAKI